MEIDRKALERIRVIGIEHCVPQSIVERIIDAYESAKAYLEHSSKHTLPEHHITANGCSVCGTDAMNCEAVKSLKPSQNTEKPWQQEVQEGHERWQKSLDEKRSKTCEHANTDFSGNCMACGKPTRESET